MKSEFTGTGALIQLILRRDRFFLPLWVIAVGLLPLVNATGAATLYPTPEAMQQFVDGSVANTAVQAIHGPIFSATIGGFAAWRSLLQVALFIILPALALTIRHTRADEDAGRRELVGATVVGRYAPLTAALIVVYGADLLIGATIAASLIAFGLAPQGAMLLGLGLAHTGLLFTALAAVAAQVEDHANGARGLTGAILGLFMLLRFAENGELIPWWLSPFTWIAYTRPFAGEQWGLALLLFVPTALLTWLAYALTARRDLGAGLWAARPGPATSSTLGSALALAWRLHRATLFSWIFAALIFALMVGSVAQGAGSMMGAQFTDWMIMMDARDPGDALLLILIYALCQCVALYGIQSALVLRAEEDAMRADHLLATPVTRARWAMGHLLCAFAGSTAILLAFGLVVSVVYGWSVGNVAGEVPRLLARVVMTLPAVWVLVGLVVALYGWLPKWAAAISWAAYALALIIEVGWELQLVSQDLFNISPFAHAHWTTAQISLLSVTILVGLAAILTTIGILAVQQRDIA